MPRPCHSIALSKRRRPRCRCPTQFLRPLFQAVHRDGNAVAELLSESLASLPKKRLKSDAIARFNESIGAPIDLRLRLLKSERGTTHAEVEAFLTLDDGRRTRVPAFGGLAAHRLWLAVGAGVLHRVKRCGVCQRWFSDESKNVSAKHCSTTCTNKYWNRARRRTEGKRRKRRTR
jgi:hypothetical protein